YDVPEIPYQRSMESGQISEEVKEELKGIYLSLNPAQLKRNIYAKLDKLCKAYEEKRGTQQG
ncbi:MAG: transposase, partial [Dehalococcoidia bacterium]|nr:transposase [Dehalococcoidia bacterium]